MSEPLLSVKHLEVSFLTASGYVTAVRDVSFDVAAREVVAVVGESGSGKSVMALSIMGLHGESARVRGSIRFDGTDLLATSNRGLQSIRGDRIAMIFQDPMSALNPLMTIGEQVIEAIQVHRDVDDEQARETAIALLERVGIPEPARRAEQYAHEFSGGMCQRAMIAMAIANEPQLLIADEPTTALDVTVQAQVMEVMREIRELTGAAMLLITHDLGLVAGSAERVLVMYGGRVMESGSVADIFYGTRNPYTRGLMGSIPHRRRNGRRLEPIPGAPPSLLEMPSGCPFAPRCALAIAACAEAVPELVPVSAQWRNGEGPHRTRCLRQSDLDDWQLERE